MSDISSISKVSVDQMNSERFNQVSQQEPKDKEQVKKLSQEFESIFMGIVLKSMRDSVNKSNFIDGGNGEQIFQSMLDTEYAKDLASQNMTGLSSAIEDHLTRLMGGGKKPDELQKAAGLAQYGRQASDKR